LPICRHNPEMAIMQWRLQPGRHVNPSLVAVIRTNVRRTGREKRMRLCKFAATESRKRLSWRVPFRRRPRHACPSLPSQAPGCRKWALGNDNVLVGCQSYYYKSRFQWGEFLQDHQPRRRPAEPERSSSPYQEECSRSMAGQWLKLEQAMEKETAE
jgi:hypothetical protein